MELEVEGRRPVGWPKTWSKVVEEDMRKFNITEDMAEDRKQWRQLISSSTPGVGARDVNENDVDNDDDDDDGDDETHISVVFLFH